MIDRISYKLNIARRTLPCIIAKAACVWFGSVSLRGGFSITRGGVSLDNEDNARMGLPIVQFVAGVLLGLGVLRVGWVVVPSVAFRL